MPDQRDAHERPLGLLVNALGQAQDDTTRAELLISAGIPTLAQLVAPAQRNGLREVAGAVAQRTGMDVVQRPQLACDMVEGRDLDYAAQVARERADRRLAAGDCVLPDRVASISLEHEVVADPHELVRGLRVPYRPTALRSDGLASRESRAFGAPDVDQQLFVQ